MPWLPIGYSRYSRANTQAPNRNTNAGASTLKPGMNPSKSSGTKRETRYHSLAASEASALGTSRHRAKKLPPSGRARPVRCASTRSDKTPLNGAATILATKVYTQARDNHTTIFAANASSSRNRANVLVNQPEPCSTTSGASQAATHELSHHPTKPKIATLITSGSRGIHLPSIPLRAPWCHRGLQTGRLL